MYFDAVARVEKITSALCTVVQGNRMKVAQK
jgi:hypothetical protein